MGARAVEVLLERITRPETPGAGAAGSPIVFPVKVIERASVAPPPRVMRLVPAPR
jgi:DNA-binding LacI/PurR family transcriptional regulator